MFCGTRVVGNTAASLRQQLERRIRITSTPRLPVPTSMPCWFGRRIKSTMTQGTEPQSASPKTRKISLYNRPLVLDNHDVGRLVHASLGGNDRKTKHLELSFEREGPAVKLQLPMIWFRDACSCSACVSESSGQRNFATCDIQADPQLQSYEVTEDGSLKLVWRDDFLQGGEHTTIFSASRLHELFSFRLSPEIKKIKPEMTLWNREKFEGEVDSRFISYSDWMEGGQAFANAFIDFLRWGIVFVRDVPESRDSVENIANKIGHLQSTIYGNTWDVISKPNAENIAYTNQFLCLHQDLLYCERMPKVQILHCLKNDCSGGVSLFSDGLRAAWDLKHESNFMFQALIQEKVHFQYIKNGNHYYQRRSVIVAQNKDSKGWEPAFVNWSPPFQGPFYPWSGGVRIQNGDDEKRIEMRINALAWHGAAKRFREILEAPENMFEYKMKPGECVLLDNSRILHGRTKFDPSNGERHLHGAYIADQTVMSAHLRLAQQGLVPYKW